MVGVIKGRVSVPTISQQMQRMLWMKKGLGERRRVERAAHRNRSAQSWGDVVLNRDKLRQGRSRLQLSLCHSRERAARYTVALRGPSLGPRVFSRGQCRLQSWGTWKHLVWRRNCYLGTRYLQQLCLKSQVYLNWSSWFDLMFSDITHT